MDYPNTFKRFSPNSTVNYPEVFDPALKQFPRAFRHGEPSFNDAATETRWREARKHILGCILNAIAKAPLRENLVLRGSVLMKQWFGDSAREPGDVDWVVQPCSIQINDAWSSALFNGLTHLAWEGSAAERAGVCIEDVRIEDLWTYDRVPGRRIVYYWRKDQTPPGSVQMDFVFGEELWRPPLRTVVAEASGENATFWAATKELSLAWKLQWLDTDMFPQGKDLYDAVLLAENTSIPIDLIKRALADRIRRSGNQELTAEFPLEWRVDWESFRAEYPWVKGEATEWQGRLANALRATIALNELLQLLDEAAVVVSGYAEMCMYCGYDTGAEFAAALRSLRERVGRQDWSALGPLIAVFAPTGAWDDGVGDEGMKLANRIMAVLDTMDWSRLANRR